MMPLVKIDMWPGRTEEQKKTLIDGITEAFNKIGVPKEHVTTIITEVPKENWGIMGKKVEKD